ncbi:MAG TPA: hypothetical protein VD927_13670 [Chryseosolibacter sp.]|nr:hypothetical protein [Chryseosolibacter sp.]
MKKTFFKSSMVIQCDYLSHEILESNIETLNQLCEEKDREGLAEFLGIDINTAKNVNEFEFEAFVTEDEVVQTEILKEQLRALDVEKKGIAERLIEKINIQNHNAFEISALVFNPEAVKPLETALINFFKNSEYIKRRMDINKTTLEARKQKLIAESGKLDSLKTVLFENYQNVGKTSRGSGNVFLGDEKLANPLDVYREDLAIHNEILAIDKQLYITPDFEVLKGFTTFKEPASASLALILFIAFWISFVAGYLIIGAAKLDQMLARVSADKEARKQIV